MAEGKYPIIVKLNLPPEDSYHSGHSIIIQGDSIFEIIDHIDQLAVASHPEGLNDNAGPRILKRFIDFGLRGIEREEAREELSGQYD